MKQRVVSATEFKAKCLAILDEVAETGVVVTVTKRGKAVAQVRALEKKKELTLVERWRGQGKILGDIITPTEEWFGEE